MASVSIERVEKSFGAAAVIHGVSIDIGDGEFVVLIGPSGCGKSTLLRMIAGLEPVTGGTISIGGRVVNDLEPKDRDIAMVFQNYALYPHMSVAKNMGFSLEHRGASKAEIAERVTWAADILGLGSLLQRRPGQLSGGQRQRVAMGRAIVRNPQVFLFDEPLSNLDAKLRVVMRGEIKALHQRLGTTTVYVTHDQVEAMTMADKIVVMNDGRVEQVGTPIELFDRPANIFVAGFIGSPSMNFIPGAQLGETATIGVRPEHFEIAEGGLPVTVTLVEPMGSDTQISGRTEGGTDLVALFHRRMQAKPGEVLSLKPLAAEVHRFDATTGIRLETREA
jgi:multiple sugar transport system ATP-binding protein